MKNKNCSIKEKGIIYSLLGLLSILFFSCGSQSPKADDFVYNNLESLAGENANFKLPYTITINVNSSAVFEKEKKVLFASIINAFKLKETDIYNNKLEGTKFSFTCNIPSKNTDYVYYTLKLLIEGYGEISFWDTYNNDIIYPAFKKINDYVLKQFKADSSFNGVYFKSNFKTGNNDLNANELSETSGNKRAESLTDQLKTNKNSNPDNDSIVDLNFNCPLFSLFQPQAHFLNETNSMELASNTPLVGITQKIKNINYVKKLIGDLRFAKLFPSKLQLSWGLYNEPTKDEDARIDLYALKKNVESDGAFFKSKDIDSCVVGKNPNDASEYYVGVYFNKKSNYLFKHAIKNIENKDIVIALDNIPLSLQGINSQSIDELLLIKWGISENYARVLYNVLLNKKEKGALSLISVSGKSKTVIKSDLIP